MAERLSTRDYVVVAAYLAVTLALGLAIFLAVPTVVLIWVLTLPGSETKPPDHAGGWGGNLKVIAAVALLLQIVSYSLL